MKHPIAAYYSSIDPEGMKGWVGLVGWPLPTFYLHKWSTTPVSYTSLAGQGKFACQRLTFVNSKIRSNLAVLKLLKIIGLKIRPYWSLLSVSVESTPFSSSLISFWYWSVPTCNGRKRGEGRRDEGNVESSHVGRGHVDLHQSRWPKSQVSK